MKNYQDNDEKNEKRMKRRIIIMLLIIVLLLLLITSCTAHFFGKMGDLFTNEEVIPIDSSTNDKEVILNEDLKFDLDNLDISLSDNASKITFNFKNINPDKFTCSTSDATIATCYVKDGHIVINPKKKGKVEVFIQAEDNGKIYKGSTIVNIGDSKKLIKLDSKSGTINLSQSKTKIVAYNLIGMKGKVSVSSSNKSVATATVGNGVIKITGHKKGNSTITISINYNGVTYKATYKVKVINGNTSGSGNNSGGNSGSTGGNTKPGGNGGSTGGNNQNKKDSDSSLKSLTTSNGTLKFNKNTYTYHVGVSKDVNKVTLKAIPTSSKATVTYTYNGKTVKNLNDLKLNNGDNTVVIKVIAEDGSTSTYKVIINKEADTTLQDLKVSVGKLDPKFKENILDYVVKDIPSDTKNVILTPTLGDKNSTIEYYINNKKVTNADKSSLNVLLNTAGIYTVKIVVKNGDSDRTYTVVINKNASDNNYLSDIKINNNSLPGFDKNTFNYDLEVDYNTKKLTALGIPEDKNSTVTYYLDDQIVDKDNIKIPNKDCTLKIKVKSESGDEKVYTINITKPNRTIEFATNKDIYEIDVLGKPYTIAYEIKENGKVLGVDDYDLADVKLNYNGDADIKIEKGYIVVTPKSNMAGKQENVSLTYNGSTTSNIKLKYILDDYFIKILNSNNNIYEMDIENGKGVSEIALLTNIFKGSNIGVKNIANGVIIYSLDNEDIFIKATTDDPDITLSSTGGAETSSPLITATANGVKEDSKEVKIHITGSILGNTITVPDVTLKLQTVYTVNLDSNGGFFSKLDQDTVYSYKLTSKDKLDLSKLSPFKDADDCHYYEVLGYSDTKDGQVIYKTDDVIEKLDKSLYLYVIYGDNLIEKPEFEYQTLYLDDANIFGDKENELYKDQKIIYPGAKGHYSMIFENGDEDITITGMILKENSICVSSGCLNMGYVVKTEEQSGNFYYFGKSNNLSEDDYFILRTHGDRGNDNLVTSKEIDFENDFKDDSGNVIDKSIKVPKNGKVNIAILWKWVDNDTVDTEIGSNATLNDLYKLSIGIKLKVTNDKCKN